MLCLALMACSDPAPEPIYLTPTIPEPLRSCPDVPDLPVGEYTQKDVAVYVVRLAETLVVCEATLEGVLEIIDTFEAPST